MKNITQLLNKIYQPHKALLFYRSESENDHYVESYDMDSLGRPINAHPLSVKESERLAEALKNSTVKSSCYLQPERLIPENVLYYNGKGEGCAIWFSKECRKYLHFRKELGISDGEASLPPLLWKATRSQIWIWALEKNERPDLSAKLYSAPFFNCYRDGRVCMGNVNINIPQGCRLEKFITEWERYYFASAFSHLLDDVSPVKTNVVQLWKKLIEKNKAFPVGMLKKTGHIIKDII
jgi:PRTRC genetic system protein B